MRVALIDYLISRSSYSLYSYFLHRRIDLLANKTKPFGLCKYVTNSASFCLFRLYQKTATKIMQNFAINGKVRWCCALDSNLWPQYRRNRQILCAMMASDWSTFVCCLFIKILFNLILSNNPYHELFKLWIKYILNCF